MFVIFFFFFPFKLVLIILSTGILVTEPYVPQKFVLPLEKAQERGRGRGKVISHSSNESVNSAANFSRGTHSTSNNNVSRETEETESPNDKKSLSSPESVERWAKLVSDTYNEVDIGEFYNPNRIYVMLTSTFQR